MTNTKTKFNPDEKKLANLIGRVIDEKTKTVLATKDDLKKFATKDDLKKFATKDDLKNAVKGLVTQEEAKKFLTKDEYYNSADQIMGELKAIREENAILGDMRRQVNNCEDRLEIVEEKLGIPLAA